MLLNLREDLLAGSGSMIAEIKACNNHQSSIPGEAKDSTWMKSRAAATAL
jgi:hypothetical protein